MARVTVEDCVLRVPNRFDLVMLAAQRARDISSGARATVDQDNDKNPVIALREIAEETVGLEPLRESLVQGLRKQVHVDSTEEDEIDMLGATDLAISEAAADSELAAGEGGMSIEGEDDEAEPGPEPGDDLEAE